MSTKRFISSRRAQFTENVAVPKALNLFIRVFFTEKTAGPVVQFGMNAAFAMRKSRVQVPPGPLSDLNQSGCTQQEADANVEAIMLCVADGCERKSCGWSWRLIQSAFGLFVKFCFQEFDLQSINEEYGG
jgi:hypothetical protein